MTGKQTETVLKRAALALLSTVLFAAFTLGCASVDEPEPGATAPDPDITVPSPDASAGVTEAGNEDTQTDPTGIVLQADSGYEAAEAFVSVLEETYRASSPEYPYTVLDYELLGWGVNEIDVDDYQTPDGEFVFNLFSIRDDYGLYAYSAHYYNAQTGAHRSMDRLGYSEGAPTRWWLEE